MKRFISWLTRPKITIFLKSGNVLNTRYLPVSNLPDTFEKFDNLMKAQNGNIDAAKDCDIEMISYRKWYQRWTKCL